MSLGTNDKICLSKIGWISLHGRISLRLLIFKYKNHLKNKYMALVTVTVSGLSQVKQKG